MTVADTGVALETSCMAYAIIFLTVVILAITALSYCILQLLPLLLSRLNGCLSFVILAAGAIADARTTRYSSLKTYAVELSTLPTLAVASLVKVHRLLLNFCSLTFLLTSLSRSSYDYNLLRNQYFDWFYIATIYL